MRLHTQDETAGLLRDAADTGVIWLVGDEGHWWSSYGSYGYGHGEDEALADVLGRMMDKRVNEHTRVGVFVPFWRVCLDKGEPYLEAFTDTDRVDQVCTECGTECSDFKQVGDKRLCILCVQVEARREALEDVARWVRVVARETIWSRPMLSLADVVWTDGMASTDPSGAAWLRPEVES